MNDNAPHTKKRLFLLRHAIAMSDTPEDINRTLAPKGKEDATALGSWMKRKNLLPDFVLCSSATRTRQTLEGLQNNLDTPKVDLRESLYHGSAGDYLSQLQDVSDNYKNVMIIAHNPSIYGFVRLLSTEKDNAFAQRLCEGYSPATLSVIECTSDTWKDIQPGENMLSLMTDPMDYNAPARPTRWM